MLRISQIPCLRSQAAVILLRSLLCTVKTLNDKDLPVKESIKMVIESNSNEVGKITLKMDLILS